MKPFNARKMMIGVGILALLYLLYHYEQSQGRGKNDGKITTMTGTLMIIPEERSHSKGDPDISIRLNEYPLLYFSIPSTWYKAFGSVGFLNSVHIGDTLTMDILSYDHDTRISGTKPLRTTDRIFKNTTIPIYGLRVKGKSYLAIEDVNREIEGDNFLGTLMAIFLFGGLFIYGALEMSGAFDKLGKWMDKLQAGH